MNNQELYESLLKEVKGELNFKQIQDLKSLKKENGSLIEKMVQKLEKRKKFDFFILTTILVLIVILSFILQTNFLPNYHRLINIILPFIAITISFFLTTEKSIPKTMKSLFVFELLNTLTKNQTNQEQASSDSISQ